jgi:hypothetical protein
MAAEPDGDLRCASSHGSFLNWQPQIHALVTDGGCRSDGSFVRLPAEDLATRP